MEMKPNDYILTCFLKQGIIKENPLLLALLMMTEHGNSIPRTHVNDCLVNSDVANFRWFIVEFIVFRLGKEGFLKHAERTNIAKDEMMRLSR
jgi:hypothetical protein